MELKTKSNNPNKMISNNNNSTIQMKNKTNKVIKLRVR